MTNLLKTLIFTLLVPGTVTMVLPYFLLSRRMELHWPYGLVGLLAALIGGGFYLWCAWDFATVGQGTPAPIDPPKVFVARGPYRVVRNPMYVSVLLILFGESIMFASIRIFCYALAVGLVMHLFVAFYEEPTLRRKFGTSYQEYYQKVLRWIPCAPRSA